MVRRVRLVDTSASCAQVRDCSCSSTTHNRPASPEYAGRKRGTLGPYASIAAVTDGPDAGPKDGAHFEGPNYSKPNCDRTMVVTSGATQKLDTDVRPDPKAWKDRVLLSALCFWGIMTAGWCRAISYGD